jgi:hypothetical protein
LTFLYDCGGGGGGGDGGSKGRGFHGRGRSSFSLNPNDEFNDVAAAGNERENSEYDDNDSGMMEEANDVPLVMNSKDYYLQRYRVNETVRGSVPPTFNRMVSTAHAEVLNHLLQMFADLFASRPPKNSVEMHDFNLHLDGIAEVVLLVENVIFGTCETNYNGGKSSTSVIRTIMKNLPKRNDAQLNDAERMIQSVNEELANVNANDNVENRLSLRSSSPMELRNSQQKAETSKCIRQTEAKVRSGKPGSLRRAAKRISSNHTTPKISVEEISNCLEKKQVEAGIRQIPNPPSDSIDLIFSSNEVRHVIRQRVDNGSAAGPTGAGGNCLGNLVLPSTEQKFPKLVDNLAIFLSYIANGKMTRGAKQAFLASEIIALAKPDAKSETDVRPIAIGEAYYRCVAHLVMGRIRDKFPKCFPSIQHAFIQGGSVVALHSINAAMSVRPSNLSSNPEKILTRRIVLSIDIENAFNCVDRTAMFNKLFSNHDLKPLWKFVHWSYARSSALLHFDRKTNLLARVLDSEQGVKQGDPLSSFLFALTVQDLFSNAVKAAKAKFKKAEHTAIAIHDDLTLIGDYESVLYAFDQVLSNAGEYGLSINQAKCKVLLPRVYRDENGNARFPGHGKINSEIMIMCEQRKIDSGNSIKILGNMLTFGDPMYDHYVNSFIEKKISAHKNFFDLLKNRDMDPQVGLLLLRQCLCPKLNYLMSAARLMSKSQLSSARSTP